MEYYDLAQHLGDTGHALFDLAVHGHLEDQAVERHAAAVEGHQPLYRRSRGMSGAKLATLVMADGDPAEAAAIGRRALEDLGGVRSARALQVIRDLGRVAAGHPSADGVPQLRQTIVSGWGRE